MIGHKAAHGQPALLRRQESTIAFGDEVRFDRNRDGKDGMEQATQAMTDAVDSLRLVARNPRRQRGL